MADEDSNEDLAMIFKLPRTGDGYFLEDHVKLRPVDLPVPGFFVAGTAHGPQDHPGEYRPGPGRGLAGPDPAGQGHHQPGRGRGPGRPKHCAACLICVRACPFGIPFINADGYSEIDPAKCHGCGMCASACPAKAIQLMQFEDDQILAKLEGLLERIVA